MAPELRTNMRRVSDITTDQPFHAAGMESGGNAILVSALGAASANERASPLRLCSGALR